MENFVASLFETQSNPILKLKSLQKKYFIPTKQNADEARDAIKSSLKDLGRLLSTYRVDKRNSRSKGEYIDKHRAVCINKILGTNTGHLGYMADKTRFLRPAEALCLLEFNRLEILRNNIPLSIFDAFNTLLPSNDLNKYLTYRKLTMIGCKIKHTIDWNTKYPSGSEPVPKKPKLDDEGDGKSSTSTELDILAQLRRSGPQRYQGSVQLEPVFKIYTGSNSDKAKPDFDVVLNTGREWEPKYGFTDSNTLVACVTPGNVAFYQVCKFTLPCNDV